MDPIDPMGTEPNRPARGRWRARAVALGASVVITIVLGELLLMPVEAFRPNPRFAPSMRKDDVQHRWLVADPRVGWRMVPGVERRHETDEFSVVYQANSAGYRGRELVPVHDRRRVLLVGDSFTFGIGVSYEETYGALLERRLANWAVYNVAMPAYGVDQMWIQIDEQIDRIDPQLLIVGICDADLARSQSAFSLGCSMNKPAFKLVDHGLELRTPKDRLGPVAQFLDENSRLWMAWRQGVRWLGYRQPIGEWWHLNAALLDAIRQRCADRDVPVLFLYVPTPEWRRFPTLADYMRRCGAHYLDLTAEEVTDKGQLHYPVDRHFTGRGHEFAARRIEAWLRENLSELASGG